MNKLWRLIGLLAVFASVTATTYSLGALITYEHSVWHWPASGQVAAVLIIVLGTAILDAIFRIGVDSEPWAQVDHYEEDRR